MKIFESNYTQIPNELLDNITEFKPAEFMVLMFICRKTFGWQKYNDRLSLSQIQKATGLSRQGVVNAINSLTESGIIVKYSNKLGNSYSIVVNKSDYGSKNNLPHEVNSVDTQKKCIKDTSTKENNIVPAGQHEPEQQQEQEEPKPKSDYQQIVDLYYKLFQDYSGRKPVIDSAFGAMVKDLLSKQTVTDIVAVMTAYFDPANRSLWFMHGNQLNWKHFRAHYDAIPTGATAEESFVDKYRRELNGGTK